MDGKSAKELKLPPVKLHCSMLAQDAVQSAIEDYMNQKNPNKPFFFRKLVIF